MTDSPVTLITGGSSGIGAAAARLLLDRGQRVTITGRDSGRLAKVSAELAAPDRLLAIAADAADYAAVQSAVASTLDTFGRLDAAVANAGFATAGNLAKGDPDEWREMVLTNVLGPALLIKATVPALRETKGRIVLVGSVAGTIHSAGNFYGATKWAMTGLAGNARLMLLDDGIGVTLINPGRIDTPFWEPHGGLPEGNVLTAAELAESIVWALSQPPGVDVNTVTVRPLGQPT